MKQDKILDKLNRFLTLEDPKNDLGLRKPLKASGHCFSFSLCYAVMASINSLAWWKHTLKAIDQWDEKESSLNQIVSLPDSTDPITLKKLFEKAINYIVYHQGGQINYLLNIKNLRQSTLLYTQRECREKFESPIPYFEIIDQKEIKTIQGRKCIAGHFEEKDLDQLLNESDLKIKTGSANCICLLSSCWHTITVHCNDDGWVLYDPNYYSKQKGDIEQIVGFDEKKQLVNTIIQVLGKDISMKVFSLEKTSDHLILNATQHFNNWLADPNKTRDILGYSTGLMLLARDAPDVLRRILDVIKESDKTPDQLLQTLSRPFKGLTGLHYLASLEPAILYKVLDIVEKSDKTPDQLVGTLSYQVGGITGLHCLASLEPAILHRILDIVEKSDKAPCQLSRALFSSFDGSTVLYYLSVKAPSDLDQILGIIEKSTRDYKFFLEKLTRFNEKNLEGLQFFLENSPSTLTRVLDLNERLKRFKIVQESINQKYKKYLDYLMDQLEKISIKEGVRVSYEYENLTYNRPSNMILVTDRGGYTSIKNGIHLNKIIEKLNLVQELDSVLNSENQLTNRLKEFTLKWNEQGTQSILSSHIDSYGKQFLKNSIYAFSSLFLGAGLIFSYMNNGTCSFWKSRGARVCKKTTKLLSELTETPSLRICARSKR